MDFFSIIKLTATWFTIFMVVVGTVSYIISKLRKKPVKYGNQGVVRKKKTVAQGSANAAEYAPGHHNGQKANQVPVNQQAMVARSQNYNYQQQAAMAKQRTQESAFNIRSYTPSAPRERFQVINAQQPELRKIQLMNVRQPERPLYMPRPKRPVDQNQSGGRPADILKAYAGKNDRLNKLNFTLA